MELFSFGGLPAGVHFAGRAVNLSRELELIDHEAFALDMQASLYYLSGEPKQALIHFTEAIHILEQSQNLYIKYFVLNNMSLTLMALGNFDTALASVYESLRLAREQSLRIQELNAVDTIAQILLEMGNYYQEAERYLNDTLSQTEQSKFDIFQVHLPNNLGKAHLKQKHFQEAASVLQRAVLAACTILCPLC